ncbi:MAG: hypothetical protein V1884_01670, partial [Candidatus Omnitrophota bacterium]
KVIAESKLSNSNKVIKKDKEIEELLNNREYTDFIRRIKCGLKNSYYHPPQNHMWKRLERARIQEEIARKSLTFENSKKLTS